MNNKVVLHLLHPRRLRVRPLPSLLLPLLLLLFNSSSWANERTPTVELEPGHSKLQLLPYARFIKPSPQELEQLKAGDVIFSERKLNSVNYEKFYFGPADGPVMVIFKLANNSQQAGNWVFNTNRRALRLLQLTKVSGPGQEQLLFNNQDMAALKSSLYRFHNMAQEFSLAAGETAYFVAVFDAEISTRVFFEIQSLEDNHSLILNNAVWVLFFAMGTATLVLVNACLFLFIRRRVFLYFVIVELAFLYQSVLCKATPSFTSGMNMAAWMQKYALSPTA